MTKAEQDIHRIVSGSKFISDRPYGGNATTGMYYTNPKYGSGSLEVCLCENYVSLILADCTMKEAFSLNPNRDGELYITCFHRVSAKRHADGKDLALQPDVVYISDSTGGIERTVFDAGERIQGFLLLIRIEQYAQHLDAVLHTDSRPCLDALCTLDGKIKAPSIGTISRSMFHFRGDAVSSHLFYQGKAAEIVSVLLSHHPKHGAGCSAHCENVHQYQQNAEIERIVHYMSTHLSESLTAEDLAHLFSSSPSRLSSMFKKETSRTLSAYRNQLRVEEARRLLTETNLTQEEIASRVGFSRVSNFSDFFRRMTGVAPGTLRKGHGTPPDSKKHQIKV